MSLFNLFRRRGSAPVARERLQILLAHERAARGQPDLLALLREEILAVIAKHVTVERENVQVRMDRGETSRRWRSTSRSRIRPACSWRRRRRHFVRRDLRYRGRRRL